VKSDEPTGIELRDVLAIHGRLFALHGGASGVRDQGLLESALARPLPHHSYAPSPSIVKLAAIYTSGIVRNPPFLDGNKRTGFLIGVLFLELNSFDFKASEEDAAQTVFALASGAWDEKSYAVWLRKNSILSRKH
jgi:death on curing protein